MGNKEGKLKEAFLFAIVANHEGEVANLLKVCSHFIPSIFQERPDLANCSLVEDMTNPMCRAAYLGYQNLIILLLTNGADINIRSSDGRTPLMWAVFRNNVKLIEFLIESGASLEVEDKEGNNPMDIAVIMMNYQAARVLKRHGLNPKDPEHYEGKLWRKYDVPLLIEYLEEDREEVENARFFDKIKSKRQSELIMQ